MKTYDFPNQICPYCGRKMGAITETTEGAKPIKGDVTVCIKCLNHCIMTAEGGLRKPTLDENIALVENEKQWSMLLKIKEAIRITSKFYA